MKTTSRLLMALFALSAANAAFAGGTVHRAPQEPAAAEAAAPAPIPEPAPAPQPVAEAPAPAPMPVAAASFAPHAYAGGSIGRSHYGAGVGNATGGKAFAGYQFSRNFAVEGAYNNLGKVNGARAQGGSVDALGILPVAGNIDVFGKVGVADMKMNGAAAGGYKAGANYGVGANYRITPRIAARAELERFQKAGDTPVKANQGSVGLQYAF